MAGYFLYRRRHGLDPRAQYRIARPAAPARLPRARLPLGARADLRHRRRHRGDARGRPSWSAPTPRSRPLYVLQVPRRAAARRRARARRSTRPAACSRSPACRRARAGSRCACRLIRTRNPGAAIVEEASERRSDLIYISTEHAPERRAAARARRPATCSPSAPAGSSSRAATRPADAAGTDGDRSPRRRSPGILPPMSEPPQLLDDLLGAPGPSGYEGPASEVWRSAASFAELSTRRPRLLGRPDRRDGRKPLLAVVGHIDEIGLVITHVDANGFLYFAPIGGWDPQILLGQRVEVQGKARPVARRRRPQADPPAEGGPAEERRRASRHAHRHRRRATRRRRWSGFGSATRW